MIVLTSQAIPADVTDAPVSPLNVVWHGTLSRQMRLPAVGHLGLLFPLEESLIACSETVVDSLHYLLLTPASPHNPYILDNLLSDHKEARVLLLLLSPAFIAEMADFLGIPFDLAYLLHAIPLPQGDAISQELQLMAETLHHTDQTEELFMEVVGQVLRMLRLRHQSLLNLAQHKPTTLLDLIPILLRARQFMEAHYLKDITTAQIAQQVALSEYHFARLFKTAFEITVHQYVRRLRLNRARHLLEQSDISISEIAVVIGYSSLSAFIHAFRHYCGVTPSEYRSQVR